MKNPIYLGVNIDHVATIRQTRGTFYPDTIAAALLAEQAGAAGITVHLREDRRHIQDEDVVRLKQHITTRLNLEMAATTAMVNFACQIKPEFCCLVPERREELTTEGGLDVAGQAARLRGVCQQLAASNIKVSLFIAPDKAQIDAAVYCGAPFIEIHTGHYADATNEKIKAQELQNIINAAEYAAKAGLIVNAGHGLNYDNVQPIAHIPEIYELNIGHSIIARALFIGMSKAVQEMQQLMLAARGV